LPTLGRPTRATTGLRACIDHLDRERLVTPGSGSAGKSRNTCHCAGDGRMNNNLCPMAAASQ
ncbi:MAG: hypothetical protein KDD77_03745, partial [Caldilineaceae bacterium]|nr:hypothetical protein [Caldilineaceae bacterium]